MAGTSDLPTKTVILELAKEHPNGLDNAVISATLPDIPVTDVADVINELIADGSLKLFVNKDQVPFYKYVNVADSTAAAQLNLKIHEEAVFMVINDAGSKGIWAKEIASRLHLTKVEQNKTLKSLTNKKLIKSIVVPGSKLKCYILYNLEHDSTKTNSFWYESQDKIFLSNLNQWCLEYLVDKAKRALEAGGGPLIIRNNSYVKATELYQYITNIKCNTVPLDVANVENILFAFVLDNQIERIKNAQDEFLYKMSSPWLSKSGIVTSPCCGCPVSNKCGKVGSITPQTCKYFDEWLQN